ncbi:MAG: clan AA aspartic protease [Bacteroidetes bacterium]|nr:clan AA aspartic protease [Bacteroidota bacterium]
MTIKVPLDVVKIEDEGFHPHLLVKINNKVAVMLVDTGASKTVFDLELIKKYIKNIASEVHDKFTTGLGTSSMVSHKATINKLEIGEMEIINWDAVLLDLSHVNNSYEQLGIQEIAGVIGSDLLVQFKAKVDFEKSILTLKVASIV